MLYGIALLDDNTADDDDDDGGVSVLSSRLQSSFIVSAYGHLPVFLDGALACLVQQKRFALAALSANNTRRRLCCIADGLLLNIDVGSLYG